jgi:hypothetical protein
MSAIGTGPPSPNPAQDPRREGGRRRFDQDALVALRKPRQSIRGVEVRQVLGEVRVADGGEGERPDPRVTDHELAIWLTDPGEALRVLAVSLTTAPARARGTPLCWASNDAP